MSNVNQQAAFRMISFGKNFFSEPMGVFLVYNKMMIMYLEEMSKHAKQQKRKEKNGMFDHTFFFLNARYISIESTWRQRLFLKLK
jgi:hypothetical protein